jgi:hypothetical protein
VNRLRNHGQSEKRWDYRHDGVWLIQAERLFKIKRFFGRAMMPEHRPAHLEQIKQGDDALRGELKDKSSGYLRDTRDGTRKSKK